MNIRKVFTAGYLEGYKNALKDSQNLIDGGEVGDVKDKFKDIEEAWGKHLLSNDEIKIA